MAHKMGIKITGVIGVLLEAKRIGIIKELKPYLDAMLKEGFRVSKSVYEESLNLARES
jgi:predicted nucleic acid-binding protein